MAATRRIAVDREWHTNEDDDDADDVDLYIAERTRGNPNFPRLVDEAYAKLQADRRTAEARYRWERRRYTINMAVGLPLYLIWRALRGRFVDLLPRPHRQQAR